VKPISSFAYTTGDCGAVTYNLVMSDGSAIDSSVFTFSSCDQSALTLTIYTTDTTKEGVYNFILYGSLDDQTSTSVAFAITIVSHCYLQTLTAVTTSAGSYNLGDTALTKSLSAFTISTGHCTVATYTLTYSDGSAIDTTIFTYSASALTLVVSTNVAANIKSYTFLLTGSLSGDT
jgi:hypothetical protein